MLCTLISVSLVAVVIVCLVAMSATPIGRVNIFVVKREILAITAIALAVITGVIVDGLDLKLVLANKTPHIIEAEVIDVLAEKNESNLLAPKPDSVGKKLLGKIEPKDAPLRGAE